MFAGRPSWRSVAAGDPAAQFGAPRGIGLAEASEIAAATGAAGKPGALLIGQGGGVDRIGPRALVHRGDFGIHRRPGGTWLRRWILQRLQPGLGHRREGAIGILVQIGLHHRDIVAVLDRIPQLAFQLGV